MELELTEAQQALQERIHAFVDTHIAPVADQHDKDEETPRELIEKLAQEGTLGALVDKSYGGGGMDYLSWGIICNEIGRGSASLLSLLTVHTMVTQTLAQWGSEQQREKWLPKLATGEMIGAFGLTEPTIGSDASNIKSVAEKGEQQFTLTGEKRWISFGQYANLFLIIAQCEGKPTAFLVERDREGFTTEKINGMLGFRSAMLAEISMEACVIPEENLVGRQGFGFSHIANTALDQGRFCVAWGCLGIIEGCLYASMEYINQRHQFGTALKNHQLIQQMVSEMVVGAKAGRMLCYHAAHLKEKGDPSLIMETSIAKYYTSRVALQSANDAVQIHGANGCSSDYPVQRYFRDAKIMEIIEGSNQMQQIIIAKVGQQKHLMAKRMARRARKKGNR
ncbi:acyl-CoA dehydrogenase family protein [Magnetococcales bacterium HHB-1]